MKSLANVLLAIITALLILPPARAQSPAPKTQQSASKAPQQAEVSHTFLKIGDMAPDFTLKSDVGTTVKLSDFRGKKNVIVAFYVLAFTGG
jgi:cytochrome oxidase Cu insertion factor (SCO1/SenC/PrrC family)